MRSLCAWLVSTILVACAPAQPRETPAPREVVTAPPPSTDAAVPEDAADAATPVDATSPVDAETDSANLNDAGKFVAAPGCPATYGGGAACTASGKKCEYPDGTCTCAGASYCGGAAPPPELLAQLAKPRWICAPSPKKLGPDGCPLGDPSGLACTTPGKKCHYAPCCAVTVTCTGGKWVPGAPNCPP